MSSSITMFYCRHHHMRIQQTLPNPMYIKLHLKQLLFIQLIVSVINTVSEEIIPFLISCGVVMWCCYGGVAKEPTDRRHTDDTGSPGSSEAQKHTSN